MERVTTRDRFIELVGDLNLGVTNPISVSIQRHGADAYLVLWPNPGSGRDTVLVNLSQLIMWATNPDRYALDRVAQLRSLREGQRRWAAEVASAETQAQRVIAMVITEAFEREIDQLASDPLEK